MVSHPNVLRRKLSEDILASLLLARRMHETEVAERLLQALEVLAEGDLEDESLCTAYMEIAATAQGKRFQ